MDDNRVKFIPLKIMAVLHLNLDRLCQPDLQENRGQYLGQAPANSLKSKGCTCLRDSLCAYRGVDFDPTGSLDVKPEAIQRDDEVGRKRRQHRVLCVKNDWVS